MLAPGGLQVPIRTQACSESMRNSFQIFINQTCPEEYPLCVKDFVLCPYTGE